MKQIIEAIQKIKGVTEASKVTLCGKDMILVVCDGQKEPEPKMEAVRCFTKEQWDWLIGRSGDHSGYSRIREY